MAARPVRLLTKIYRNQNEIYWNQNEITEIKMETYLNQNEIGIYRNQNENLPKPTAERAIPGSDE